MDDDCLCEDVVFGMKRRDVTRQRWRGLEEGGRERGKEAGKKKRQEVEEVCGPEERENAPTRESNKTRAHVKVWPNKESAALTQRDNMKDVYSHTKTFTVAKQRLKDVNDINIKQSHARDTSLTYLYIFRKLPLSHPTCKTQT
jgi:hypothetical protein